MLEVVRLFIHQHALLEQGAPVWVAVSGGVDSMVLLTVLHQLGHPVQAVHIDHGLRGADSAADRALVVAYCAELGIPLHVEEVDVGVEVERSNSSVQMAARSLRYRVFHRLVHQGPERLAMAHHADDAMETTLMNLMQGMGTRGWQGIPVRSGPFIRPLLTSTRADIIEAARILRVPWREDASNSDPAYLRARVRKELVPLMEDLRPGVRTVMYRNVELARELDLLAKQRINELVAHLRPDAEGVLRITFDALRASLAPRVLLHTLLEGRGYHPDRIADMVRVMEQGKVGARFPGEGVEVLADREAFLIVPFQQALGEWTIHDPFRPPTGMPLDMRSVHASDIDANAGPNVVWLDIDRLVLPLVVRPWRAGDRLLPAGMTGSKLISDVLIDAKVPRHLKDRTLVLCDAERILWCCGIRASGMARASANTQRVLRVDRTID